MSPDTGAYPIGVAVGRHIGGVRAESMGPCRCQLCLEWKETATLEAMRRRAWLAMRPAGRARDPQLDARRRAVREALTGLARRAAQVRQTMSQRRR